jgi:hypothetical protein
LRQTQRCSKAFDADVEKVFIEVAERRQQGQRFDPDRLRAFGQGRRRSRARRFSLELNN